MASSAEGEGEIVRLRRENAALRAEIEALKKAAPGADQNAEPVTLDSIHRKLEAFIAASEHTREHGKSDEVSNDVKALSLAEEQLTPEQITEARQVFDSYDEDKSGAIDSDELAQLLSVLGERPGPEKLAKMVEEVDENQNGVIDFTEFLTLFSIIIGDRPEGENIKRIKLSNMSYYCRIALPRWIKNDDEEIAGDITGPLVPGVRSAARSMCLRKDAEMFFYLCIVSAGVTSGLQTYEDFQSSTPIMILEWFTLGVFTVEIVAKLLAESDGAASGFFTDMWNTFDFVVLVSLLVLTPLGEGEIAVVRILRLLRAVRILRAAKMVPRLTLVLETLIKSAGSVVYIGMFMLLVMYIFAIVGVTVFAKNDPFHFGNLGLAMLALYRIATLEDWCDIMYFNVFGCDEWGDYAGDVRHHEIACKHEAFPKFGTVYFCVYVLFSAFLLLNLFIGVITTAMNEAQSELHDEKKDAARLAMATRLKARQTRRVQGKVANPVWQTDEELPGE